LVLIARQARASVTVYFGHPFRCVLFISAPHTLDGQENTIGSRLIQVRLWVCLSRGEASLTISQKRCLYALWLVCIGGFALLHALHLSADFPNHTLWFFDWAKYTDEGWYGSAATRAHLLGNWYLAGDFNPAAAVPAWPFAEWLLYFFTGVSIVAARGLAVAFFFCNLGLSYLLLRASAARWMALLALTLIVTSPLLYCFSRLAILEPMLIASTLAAMNLAVRLPRIKRPVAASVAIGLLFVLMALTKTTAVFLLPALCWTMLRPLWHNRRLAARCALAAFAASAAASGLWLALLIHLGLFAETRYFFAVTQFPRPSYFYWPLLSLWHTIKGGLWVDQILIPLAGLVVLGAILLALRASSAPNRALPRQDSAGWNRWACALLADPIFGASILAVAGDILFMTIQNYPQPRYFAVVAFFCLFLVAQGAGSLLGQAASENGFQPRHLGLFVLATAILATAFNGLQTLNYAAHPEYTFVQAAQGLTRYIDEHPNGNRLLLASSSDEISLITHLPALCAEFGMLDMQSKLALYQPGWFASWNDIDSDTLEDIHTRFSLEQVASFRAFDDPNRNVLVLFKLHPLPGGRVRDPDEQDLQVRLPDDKFEVSVQ
jgi:hypothetical protein